MANLSLKYDELVAMRRALELAPQEIDDDMGREAKTAAWTKIVHALKINYPPKATKRQPYTPPVANPGAGPRGAGKP